MKLCRYDHSHIGVILNDEVVEITDLFNTTPSWPIPPGDWIVRQFPDVLPKVAGHIAGRKGVPLSSVRLDTPVANPGKIIGAPVNYAKHQAEAAADKQISGGREVPLIGQMGLFLKATSALNGPNDAIRLAFSDRRNDHELELGLVIGKEGYQIAREDALSYVAAYSIALDMTVRGKEVQCFRKSADTYAVMGPWLVTADEIPDPSDLRLKLLVNGETRQEASTRDMIYDVPRLIEYASSMYTLYPGDIIMTGTPEGVSEVLAGDVLDASLENIGEMRLNIIAAK
jgi:2-keto-4-pentenoate hydratase/2-oxohepta-3-ene-1,7-dioic acid hydratase in catechol pathway